MFTKVLIGVLNGKAKWTSTFRESGIIWVTIVANCGFLDLVRHFSRVDTLV